MPHAQDFARESLHRRGGMGVAAEVRNKVGAGLRRPLDRRQRRASSDQIIKASGVEAARPQLARHRLATSFLDDQDERIDVSRMLDMAAMRAIMRRFGKLTPPAVSVQRRLDLAPPRSKRCAATLALAWLDG